VRVGAVLRHLLQHTLHQIDIFLQQIEPGLARLPRDTSGYDNEIRTLGRLDAACRNGATMGERQAVAEVKGLTIGGVSRNVANGKLLKAAFENELEQGRRANSAGTTDHAQFHPESPRRVKNGTPGRSRPNTECRDRDRRKMPAKRPKTGSPTVLSG